MDDKPYPFEHSWSQDIDGGINLNSRLWRIVDVADNTTSYVVKEFLIKTYLQRIQNLKAYPNIFQNLFQKCKNIPINITTEKEFGLPKDYRFFLNENGDIKKEWIRNLILYSIQSFNPKIIIFSFQDLVERKIILQAQEEKQQQDEIFPTFWEVGNKIFAKEIINHVVEVLNDIYITKNFYALIVWLKIWCENPNKKATFDSLINKLMSQVKEKISADTDIQEIKEIQNQLKIIKLQAIKAQEILKKTLFLKQDGTLNIWAKIIVPKVIFAQNQSLLLYNFKQLIENKIILPRNQPYLNDDDIISSESVSQIEDNK